MTRFVLTVALILLPACFARIYAQQPAEIPRLQAQTAGDQATFRQGERIPLELSFTGPAGKRFEIIASASDRSGRNSYEDFEVSPADGWVDPLKTYFSGGSVGGGFQASGFLSAQPVVISIDLNEWVRFEQPGDYKVTITSHRVSDLSAGGPPPFGQGGIELRSDAIELHIIAASKPWQDAQLAAILSELKAEPEQRGLQLPARQAAIGNLRYLGTAGAARLMAQHMREDEPSMLYQCTFGLMGLPDKVKPDAVTALRDLIENPTFPVSPWFLTTYAMVQLRSSDSDAQTLVQKRQQIESEDLKLVVSSLLAKRGRARAETIQTILNKPKTELTPAMEVGLESIMRSSLEDLPIQKQSEELNNHWELLRSPALLPVLKKDAQTASDDPRAQGDPHQVRDLKEVAFRRWYELDPDGAHEELLSQIGSGNPSMGTESLAFLPDEKLPQYERIWANAFILASDYNVETKLASLMTRFGTGIAVAQVREKAGTLIGKWACAPQGAALAYLVKFDTASARPLVERAIAERGHGKTACNQSLFQDIAQYESDSILTQAAIATLNDPDPEVINDALIYLMSYGDKSCERPLLDRYVAWSRQWSGRESELEARQVGSLGNWAEIGLGENLASALIANQGWLADDGLISRVSQLCIGKQLCDRVKQIANTAKVEPFPVSAFKAGSMQNYEIAQYSAKSLELLDAKIAQFPRGSRFVLENNQPDTEDQRHLEDQVKAVFENRGMILERSPRPVSIER
jgi:hypothetical protein